DRHQKSIVSISEETMRILMAHSWPGNVRELSNIIERAVVFCNSQEICISDLPSHLVELGGDAMPGASARGVRGQDFSTIEVPIGAPLKQVEELLIRKTLEATEGDKNMTARLLGINSRTIYRKLDKLVEKEIDSE
ncbi:MAG: helix-turn-helix domain-containing protein, partial [Bdellovibrionota bacterium]